MLHFSDAGASHNAKSPLLNWPFHFATHCKNNLKIKFYPILYEKAAITLQQPNLLSQTGLRANCQNLETLLGRREALLSPDCVPHQHHHSSGDLSFPLCSCTHPENMHIDLWADMLQNAPSHPFLCRQTYATTPFSPSLQSSLFYPWPCLFS